MNKKFILFIFFSFLQLSAFAQDDDNSGLPPLEDPPLAPIDNWIPVLILMAVLFAYYRIRQLKPKNSSCN